MSKCVLCDKDLSIGLTNMEHYVPATAIRNFDKLGVHKFHNWALRVNEASVLEREGILAPRSEHKKWATVRVHQKCNLDASPMCRKMKEVIDNLDRQPSSAQGEAIAGYYAQLWGVDAGSVEVATFKKPPYVIAATFLLYAPGTLQLGRLGVWCSKDEAERLLNDFERHTIFLGTREGLEKLSRQGYDK